MGLLQGKGICELSIAGSGSKSLVKSILQNLEIPSQTIEKKKATLELTDPLKMLTSGWEQHTCYVTVHCIPGLFITHSVFFRLRRIGSCFSNANFKTV